MSRISHLTLAFIALTVLAYSANIVWGQAQQSAPSAAQSGATSGGAGTRTISNSGPIFFNNSTFNRNGTSGQGFNNQGFNQGFNNQAFNNNQGPNSSGFFSQGPNSRPGFGGQGFSGQGIFSQGSNFQTPNTAGANSGGTINGFNNGGFNNGFNNGFNRGFANGGFANGGFFNNGFNTGFTGLVPNGLTSTNTGFPGNYNLATLGGYNGMSDGQYQQYMSSLTLQGGVSAQQMTGAAPNALGLYDTSSQISGHVFTGALGEQTTMYPADFLHRTGTLGPLTQQEAAAWNRMNNNRQVYGAQSLIIGSQSEMKPTVIASKDVLVDGIPQRVSGAVIQEVDYAPDISTAQFENERAGRQLALSPSSGITTVSEKNAYVRFRSALTRKNHR